MWRNFLQKLNITSNPIKSYQIEFSLRKSDKNNLFFSLDSINIIKLSITWWQCIFCSIYLIRKTSTRVYIICGMQYKSMKNNFPNLTQKFPIYTRSSPEIIFYGFLNHIFVENLWSGRNHYLVTFYYKRISNIILCFYVHYLSHFICK